MYINMVDTSVRALAFGLSLGRKNKVNYFFVLWKIEMKCGTAETVRNEKIHQKGMNSH